MNNVKESIGWADFTWNPVTGCLRGCEYCYARKMHQRFNKKPFEKIVFHKNRVVEPRKVKKPSIIFVGSNTDLEYWTNEQNGVVVLTCDLCHWHTFMFLSKEPRSYDGVNWPENSMQGLTVEMSGNKVLKDKMFEMVKLSHPYLSIEPIAGGLWYEIPKQIELVIVGAETGNRKGKIIPQKEWINSIKDHVPSEKIYWKKNIQRYL